MGSFVASSTASGALDDIAHLTRVLDDPPLSMEKSDVLQDIQSWLLPSEGDGPDQRNVRNHELSSRELACQALRSTPSKPPKQSVQVLDNIEVVPGSVQLILLPPTLCLLYEVAEEMSGVDPNEALRLVLRLIAENNELDRREKRLESRRLEDPCYRLYTKSKEDRERQALKLDAKKKEVEGRMYKKCTFKPTLSKLAQTLPSMGAEGFLNKCLQWNTTRQRNLERARAKAWKEADSAVEDTEVKMSERTRRLAQKQEIRKRDAKAEEELLQMAGHLTSNVNVSVDGHSVSVNELPRRMHGTTSDRLARDMSTSPGPFHPLTNDTQRPDDRKQRHCGFVLNGEVASTKGQTASGGPSGGLRHLLDDVEQRKERYAALCEKRRLELEDTARERCFDAETGQPLFRPNAMPTVRVNAERIPIDQLPPADKEKAVVILRSHGLDHLASRRHRPAEGHRAVDPVASVYSRQAMELESNRDPTSTFKPAVCPRSEALVRAKGSYQRPEHRDLPRKRTEPEPVKPKKSTNDEAIEAMLERSKQWEQRRMHRMARKERDLQRAFTKECPFAPARDRDRDALAAAAEHRFASEVAMLQKQHEEEFRSSYADPHGFDEEAHGPRRSHAGRGRLEGALAFNGGGGGVSFQPSAEVHDDADDYQLNTHPTLPEAYRGSRILGSALSSPSPITSIAHQAPDGSDGLVTSWSELDDLTDNILQQVSSPF